MPPAEFPAMLDIACGPGRHASRLAMAGYKILGIDKDLDSVSKAAALDLPDASFQVRDMRDICRLGTNFDCAINLWHSFGYYDEAKNAEILLDIGTRLRRGGRAIFDIYNRDHMLALPPESESSRHGSKILTLRSWRGKRMRCEIHYETQPADILDWHLYTSDEFAALAESWGFIELTRCAWFNENLRPSAEHARMQFVFERG
jgi:SAM-dependent methyltransferase